MITKYLRKGLILFAAICLAACSALPNSIVVLTSTVTPQPVPTQIPPTATVTAIPSVTPTLTPAAASLEETLRSEALHLSYRKPTGWIITERDNYLYITSSSDVLNIGISEGPAVIIGRSRESLLPSTDLEDALSAVAGILTLDKTEKTLLDGQEALTASYTSTINNKTVVGRVTIARQDGADTVVLIGSKLKTWDEDQKILQQVQDSLDLDDLGDLPPATKMPASLLEPLHGLLQAQDVPNGFILINRLNMFNLRRSEAYFDKWLQTLDPSMAGQHVENLQVLNKINDEIVVFTSRPLSTDQIRLIDRLIANPQKLANTVNQDPNVTGTFKENIKYTLVPGTEKLGEKGSGVLLNQDDQYFSWHETILFRRGAVLAVVRHPYQYPSSLEQTELIKVAQALDGHLKELIADRPELKNPAPRLVVQADPMLALFKKLDQAQFKLPDGYKEGDFPAMDMVGMRIVRYGFRDAGYRSFMYGKNAEQEESIELSVVYPLDTTEQPIFDWMLQNPQAMAEYFISLYEEMDTSKLISYQEWAKPLPTSLPAELGPNAGDVRLSYSRINQDVALVRYKNMLVVVTIFRYDDKPFVADIGDVTLQFLNWIKTNETPSQ